MNSVSKLLLAGLAGSTLLGAAEPMAKAPVTRAALFKNGYALIIREVAAAPADVFLLDESIAPVHGTLWFAPGDGLSVTGVKQPGTVPNKDPFSDLAASYENVEVTVTLKSSGNEPPRIVSGTMVRLGERRPAALPQPAVPQYGYWPPAAPAASFLAVRQKDGKLITFRGDQVASIESAGINTDIREEKRMLLVNRRGTAGAPLYITYLAQGLTWAPAYRIALGPDSKLQLDQSATVINELEDLKDAEISLVSGFPNLQYIGVASPLASGMTLRTFLQQLNGNENPGMGRNMVFAQAAMNAPMSAAEDAAAVSPLPGSGTTEDIHFTPAGKVTLAKGDVFYRTLASASAEYERLVEWEIPDRRNEWGQFERNYNSRGENPNGDLWDAVRFRNPLSSPITTSPVEIVDGEKLLGQSTIKWVNPGEEALVKITKALTVSGVRTEYEISDKREIVRLGGWNYRRTEVEGTVKLRNFRSTAAKVVAKLQFSGELLSAQDAPKSKLLETGVYSVNPRRELTWEITLKPGEEITCSYKYSVLVRD
ncbi:MAG: hypothetical protein HPZ91_18165 [Lentisphaeria bacterium]|nr:hypothetical protein [Lentisphaeria bacterium]